MCLKNIRERLLKKNSIHKRVYENTYRFVGSRKLILLIYCVFLFIYCVFYLTNHKIERFQ